MACPQDVPSRGPTAGDANPPKPQGPKQPKQPKQEATGESSDSPFWHREEALWSQDTLGDCQIQGPCLSSPNFPHDYGFNERCAVSLPPFSVVRVTNFSTEKGYDHLAMNGYKYSGPGFGVEGISFVLFSNISWSSDGWKRTARLRWRICVEKPPSCSDGFELTPVPVSDCPSATDPLPDCDSAEKGQLCEGDGTCGTREDINNCYVGFDTYRPTRDVYRKRTGAATATETSTTRTVTTRTTTTRTTTTLTTITTLTLTKTSTTSTTTPLMFRTTHGDCGAWTVGGPCQVNGSCWESPNFPNSYGPNELCVAALPAFSVIRIDEFFTEKYFDHLTVNGYTYSGYGLNGTSTSLWSNISWSSDGWNAGKQRHGKLRWRICVEKPPSCSDGLDLTPVPIADCPSAEDILPDCHSAGPGQLCQGDGTCGTRQDINNCYDRFYTFPPSSDVYRKDNGTTRTSTTSQTATTTSATASTTTSSSTTLSTTTSTGSWKTDGLWHYSGQCVIKDNCAKYDESGYWYSYSGQCASSFPTATFVEATLTKFVLRPKPKSGDLRVGYSFRAAFPIKLKLPKEAWNTPSVFVFRTFYHAVFPRDISSLSLFLLSESKACGQVSTGGEWYNDKLLIDGNKSFGLSFQAIMSAKVQHDWCTAPASKRDKLL